ncbi:hypothetical protein OHA25_26560 [Nonomuraea sp. NBC_00507]|uniref:hypothetical protein n=1 Tax=Nonomuraea sp. NBC_00507 TaxID=2976002 RepID=UPI002E19C280
MPPVVLVAVGVHGLAKQGLSALDVGWLAVTVLLGVAFGAVRAATTVLYARNGVLWQRYTAKTLVVWVATFAAGVGVGALAITVGMHPEARSMPLSIGVGLLGEALVVLLRSRVAGVPLSTGKR